MQGVLDGIRVLDFGRFIAGPYCGQLLADFGADVIRMDKVGGSEDRFLLKAIDEIIEIGRQAQIPVQISHIKLAMTSLWGRGPEILSRLDAARGVRMLVVL